MCSSTKVFRFQSLRVTGRLSNLSLVILCYFAALPFGETNSNLFQTSKRNEVISGNSGGFSNLNFFDDQLCLSSFEMSERSIIRTTDSLSNGARYLNVTELGASAKSKDECLRLCCRTPHCNLITYEEKQAGSCYLFDCGSLENFLCKFTEQSQYLSAILRKREDSVFLPQLITPQQKPQLPIQQTQNRHEVELNQLRNMEGDNKGSQAEDLVKNKLNSHDVVVNGLTTISPLLALDGNSRRCSRYQFECKSSGECIAIYNACDGIQQCPDGSDEAAELHCPSVVDGFGMSSKTQQAVQNPQGGVASSGSSSLQTSGGSGVSESGQPQHPQQDFRFTQQGGDASKMNMPQLQPLLQQQGSNNYNPRNNGHGDRLNLENMNRPGSGNNMIFNHKDGGIMDDSYGPQTQQQKPNPFNYWKSYDYGLGEMPLNNGYGQPGNPSGYGNGNNGMGNYGPQYPYQGQGYSGGGGMPPPNYNNLPQNTPNQYFKNNLPPLVPNSEIKPNLGVPNSPQAIPPPQPAPTIANNAAVIPTQPTTTVKPAVVPPAAVATTKQVTTSKPTVNQQSVVNIPSASKHESKSEKREKQILQSLLSKATLDIPKPGEEIDEFSDIDAPGFGAILAFIIGLGMSAVMIVIVSCRLRRMKGAGRRRGKNRLDPDYLVDGMYL